MKISFRKAALSVLIAMFMACVVCLGIFSIPKEKKVVKADNITTNIHLSADKTTVIPGETFILSATLSTTNTSSTWDSANVVVTPSDGAGGTNTTINQYLSAEQTEDAEIPGLTDKGWYENLSSDGFALPADQNPGAYMAFAFQTKRGRTPTSTTVSPTVSMVITIDEGIVSTGVREITFAVRAIPLNYVFYNSMVDQAEGGSSAFISDTVTISLGAATTEANLATLHAGHGSAGTALDISNSSSIIALSPSSNRNNFMFLPVLANDSKGATITIGTTNPPATTVADGATATVPLGNTGRTTVYIRVTAQAAAAGESAPKTKLYTITVESQIALLSGLTMSYQPPASGATNLKLAPNFAQTTYTYTATVPKGATSVTLTPTVLANYGIVNAVGVATTDCTAATSVNSGSGLTVTNIKDSGSKVVFTVTSAHGDTQTYTVNFSALSTDTAIQSFTVTSDSGSTVASDPSQGVDYYFKLTPSANTQGKMNVTLPAGTTNIKIKKATEADSAFKTLTSNDFYGVGSYTIRVTAPAGNYKDYVVQLVREDVPAEFESLGICLPGETGFTPVLTGNADYDSATKTYTKTLTISETNKVGATFRVEGTLKAGGTYGTPTGFTGPAGEDQTFTGTLALGDNSYSIVVQNGGLTNTYRFNIKLTEGKNAITDIKMTNNGSAVSGFTFNAATKTYTLTVPYATSSLDFELTTDGTYTRVATGATGAGYMNKPNHPGDKHVYTRPLTEGDNSIVFRAVADDGKGASGDLYTINVKRTAASTDNKLSGLVVKLPDDTVLPFEEPNVTFDPDTQNYVIKIDRNTDISTLTVKVEATARDPKATVNGDGTINLGALGATADNVTRVPVTVTSEKGDSYTYYIAISQKAIVLDDNFDITDITITGNDGVTYFGNGADQKFSVSTHEYTFDVPYLVDRVSVFVEAFATAEKFGGGDKALQVGENVFEVYAVAQNGQNGDKAVKYTFKINRAEPITEVYLANLRIDGATVANFDKEKFVYSVSQDETTESITLNAVAENERATVTVLVGSDKRGEEVGEITLSGFALGAQGTTITVTINVTLDGTTTPYTLNIYRATDRPLLVYLQIYDGGKTLDIFENILSSPIDGTNADQVSATRDFKVRTGNRTGKMTVVARPSDPSAIMNVAYVRGVGLKQVGEYEWEFDMEELYNSPYRAIQIVVRPVAGTDARDEHQIHFNFLTSEINFGLKIRLEGEKDKGKYLEDFNENYAQYLANKGMTSDLATFLQYNVAFSQKTLTFEVDFGADAFIQGSYQILWKKSWENKEKSRLADSDSNTNFNSELLVDYNRNPESLINIQYGLNVLVVNLRSSDESVIQPVVILINRENPDFKALSVREIESFGTDYRGEKEEYLYTVENGVKQLTVTAEVAEGLRYEIAGADGNKVDLKVGMNEIKIYLYEDNGNVGVSRLADEEEQPVKVVTLNVNREEAKDNMKLVWMVLFFIMLGLALLLLLILLFIPKRKKTTQQQVIYAPAPFMMQPTMMQQPQQPQQPQSGKSPVNVEVRITGDGTVQTNADNGKKR